MSAAFRVRKKVFAIILVLTMSLTSWAGITAWADDSADHEEMGQSSDVRAVDIETEEDIGVDKNVAVEKDGDNGEPGEAIDGEAVEEDTGSDAEDAFTYDPQPESMEDVQAAIDTFIESGVKAKWEFEVAPEFMPDGYRCDCVEDEELGVTYWSFFQNIAARYYLAGVYSYADLIKAVKYANSGDVITIAGDIKFDNTIIIEKDLIFEAKRTVRLTVAGSFRHFDIREENGGDIRLEFVNVELIGRKTFQADTTPGGGIIINRIPGHFSLANKSNSINTLYLVNAVIKNCHNVSSNYGGAVSFTWPQGQVAIDYCNLDISGEKTDISGNSSIRGGGISANHITIHNGTIRQNTASDRGGGVYAYDGVTMNGGIIRNNKAGYGGGIQTYPYGEIAINGGTISGNTALVDGGGIWISSLPKLTVAQDVIFADNKARAYYDISPQDKAMHARFIKTTAFTNPFVYGYNNYDINYAGGELSILYTVREIYLDTDGNRLQEDTVNTVEWGYLYDEAAPAISDYVFSHAIIDNGEPSYDSRISFDVFADMTVTYVYGKAERDDGVVPDSSPGSYGKSSSGKSNRTRYPDVTTPTAFIENPDVPLSDLPDNLVFIGDENVPLGKLPQTGGSASPVTGIIELLALAAGFLIKKKTAAQ